MLGPRYSVLRAPRLGGQRQGYGEHRALALAFAIDANGAPVGLDELAGDGETEAETAVLAACRVVGLAEALEDEGKELGIDSQARVGDLNVHGLAVDRRLHAHPSARRRELHRVPQEVEKHLLQP